MFTLLQSLAAETPQDGVKDFVFDAFERNAVIAMIALLCVGIITIFFKWQSDVRASSKEQVKSLNMVNQIAADNRNAVAKIVEDFNNRLDKKDKEVMKFALEMRDVIHTVRPAGAPAQDGESES